MRNMKMETIKEELNYTNPEELIKLVNLYL